MLTLIDYTRFLNLARKLTDKAVKAIAENCPRLCVIDLTNLRKLTDNALGHLANGCQSIQSMKFQRNAFRLTHFFNFMFSSRMICDAIFKLYIFKNLCNVRVVCFYIYPWFRLIRFPDYYLNNMTVTSL